MVIDRRAGTDATNGSTTPLRTGSSSSTSTCTSTSTSPGLVTATTSRPATDAGVATGNVHTGALTVAPCDIESPAAVPSRPSVDCTISATTRPERSVTEVATRSRSVTMADTSTTATLPPRTTIPCNCCGVRVPSSVSNDTSTVASPGNGLNMARVSREPARVVPAGNHHAADGSVEQSPALRPALPRTSCDTAMPPPATSTNMAAHGARSTSEVRTVAEPWAFTVRAMLARLPVSENAVT